MDVALLVLALLAAVLHTMTSGIHLLGTAALTPSWHEVSAAVYVEAKQAADRCFPVLMRPLTLAGLGVVLLLTASSAVAGDGTVAVLAGVAVLAAVAGLVGVLRGDLPVNRRMAEWSPQAPPAGWEQERATWERWFALRTAASAVAAAASLAALVVVSGQG